MSSELNRALFRYYSCYLMLSRRTRKEREWSPDEGERETPPDASVVDPDQVGSENSWPSLTSSVVDPDPDPSVFGPPGSEPDGSGFFYHQAKIVRKPLIPTVL
jgi:hypothetical protein